MVKSDVTNIVHHLNNYLRGENVENIRGVLERLGRGGRLPHWYELLNKGQSMPNLDGKTIGSVVEMTLVGVLEMHVFQYLNIPPLNINPAKGVDIPLLELGVKSPSENFCTSEPYFSAYERVLGNECDALILLTDYQTAKKLPPPVRIQIIKAGYLSGSEVADKNLCAIVRKSRDRLNEESEALCKKMLQFVCHVNQQDWRASSLLKLLDNLFSSAGEIEDLLDAIEADFQRRLRKAERENKEPLPDDELDRFLQIRDSRPLVPAIINACNDWVIDNHKDFARLPNDNEWKRFLSSPLDGVIGMSFALQWRYNFSNMFSSLDNI